MSAETTGSGKQSGTPGGVAQLTAGATAINWRAAMPYGAVAGLLMALALVQAGVLSFVAGIIPVGVGLLLARRVAGRFGLHGFIAGLTGAVVAVLVLYGLIFWTDFGARQVINSGLAGTNPTTPIDPATLEPQVRAGLLAQSWLTTSLFVGASLITFCTFGTMTAGRSELRTREQRMDVKERGGNLDRPGVIRTVDDITGLSLPQLGGYVRNLFTKNGFKFTDWKFIDKDRHLDMWFEHEQKPYHLRLSVEDKVSPGTVESLLQDMRREDVPRGIIITSTSFAPGALKAGKNRPIVLIDGAMLYRVAEGK